MNLLSIDLMIVRRSETSILTVTVRARVHRVLRARIVHEVFLRKYFQNLKVKVLFVFASINTLRLLSVVHLSNRLSIFNIPETNSDERFGLGAKLFNSPKNFFKPLFSSLSKSFN